MSAPKLSLKLLIDQKTNKVLFAEAEKEAVDFLFSILTLPISTVITLLSEQGMVGCLANLYDSIQSMKKEYVQNDQNKVRLLKPKVQTMITSHLFLLADDDDQPPKKMRKVADKKFYRCRTTNGFCYQCRSYKVHHYVTDNPENTCPDCCDLMDTEVPFVGTREEAIVEEEVDAGDASGFVKGVATYMVMDDLVVAPMSTLTGITLLNKFNVTDIGALDEKVVDLDMAKALKLLKTSLHSKDVLTTVFL